MNKKNIKTWAKALRSGEYKQGFEALQNSSNYCCLGVACSVFIPKKDQKLIASGLAGFLPEDQPSAPHWLRHIDYTFKSKTGEYISALNDGNILLFDADNGRRLSSLTHNEIADLLELVYLHGMLD